MLSMMCRWDAQQRKVAREERPPAPQPPPNTDIVLTGKVQRSILEEYNRAAMEEWNKAQLARANPKARMRQGTTYANRVQIDYPLLVRHGRARPCTGSGPRAVPGRAGPTRAVRASPTRGVQRSPNLKEYLL